MKGVWDKEATTGKSSTWRELLPIEVVVNLCAERRWFNENANGVMLLVTTDSQAVFHMIQLIESQIERV